MNKLLFDVKARKACTIFLLFVLFSFLGWCAEKALFLFAYHDRADRGFLTLPVCPIYGGALVAVRLMFGLPVKEGEKYPWNVLRLLGYALASSLVATAAELFTGAIFHDLFGIRLWSYAGYPNSYKGYVCLSMSVCWGVLIAGMMSLVWAPLERRLENVPVRRMLFPCGAIGSALAVDFIVNLLRVI